MNNLRSKAIQGLSFGVAGRVVVAALQIVTSLATARYLTPSDFGLVAFALVYINFLAQFSDFGISTAVVQKGEASLNILMSALAIKLLVGVGLTVVGILVGLVVTLFEAVASGYMIMVLSFSFLLGTATFLPYIKLTLKLDYRRMFWVSATSIGASTILTVFLLVSGWRYWAVVVAYVFSVVVASVHLNLIEPCKYRFKWNSAVAAPLFKFGLPVFLTGLTAFFVTYGGNLAVGTVLGTDALGLYALAFTFSFMLVNQIGGILSVLFPIYSQIKGDLATVRMMFMHSLEYTAAAGVLINVGLICLAQPFFYLILGNGSEKWFPALDVFTVLCFNGILAALLFCVAPLVVAIGRPQSQLRAVVVSAAVQVVLIVPALHYGGIQGAAFVLSLGMAAQVIIYLPILKSQVQIKLSDIMSAVMPAVVAGSVMALASRSIFSYLPALATVDASLWTMALQTCLLVAIFLTVHGLLTGWRLLHQLRDLAREMAQGTWSTGR